MEINFLKYHKIYFIFTGILIGGGLVCLILFGLNPGIDFTGGSILEIQYKKQPPSPQEIKKVLKEFDLGEIFIQPTNKAGVLIRIKDISEKTHQEILKKLKETGELKELRFQSIGPVIGRELKEKTKILVVVSLISIVAYIGLAFRRVQRPVKTWWLGLAALVALFHDGLIPLFIFSLLGKFYGVQITIPVVVALLTVLGYSINDTVVVLDRIRENFLRRMRVTFEETVNLSLNQVLIRSINTSLTTLFVLGAIFFLGGETLRYFSLALIIGVTAGTYSSLFLVPPLLVSWLKWHQQA